tara:strand:- start:823 stop:1005 length:183 start_codon:yes stop_codon:yes gene_type:complete
MENFTMAELGIFCTAIGGVITTIILTIQKSRCETISVLGCIKCKRKIEGNKPEPEPEPEA